MIHKHVNEFKENIKSKGALLSLDIGENSIGLALSDPERIIASPYYNYQRRNINKDTGYIKRIILEKEVCGIVIGFPLSLKGLEGENCSQVISFTEKILKKIEIPVFLQDERFSTVAVTNAMKSGGVKRQKRHSLDDELAACYILQITIDSMKASFFN